MNGRRVPAKKYFRPEWRALSPNPSRSGVFPRVEYTNLQNCLVLHRTRRHAEVNMWTARPSRVVRSSGRARCGRQETTNAQ
jgi:hypothetical protein